MGVIRDWQTAGDTAGDDHVGFLSQETTIQWVEATFYAEQYSCPLVYTATLSLDYSLNGLLR